ncbi:general substrate transporter [Saccharata proteae CBS 121410]|uniref:General substrate transporter n=1 Tax=Saccharata proteae CBS 121410 TaxID=1314787 RepID=A0A9P4LVE3_9PEZI|nr:general substrate transporter [Saccharata proteae CBS 121410]
MGLGDMWSRKDANDANASPSDSDVEKTKGSSDALHIYNWRVLYMGVLVSMGGFIFGYDTGQISGFLEMDDFLSRFGNTTDSDGNPAFTNVRSGTIVGLLSIGTLLGALVAAPIADKFGRKYSIMFWNLIFIVGVIVQIVTDHKWYQIAIGRWVAGLGVGGLSVLTPMYQSETAPRQIRGSLVSAYQLFITLGIFTAYCINYGTSENYDGQPDSWRIPMGIGFIWPAIMAGGMLFLRESPRWDYRHGKKEAARNTISKSYGVPENHPQVEHEIMEIELKLDAELAGGGKHPWYEIFTGPRMMYRTLLGMTLQALQQLTGANFFFYYGTTIFTATGLNNSFVTSMILGAVNFVCTFPGLYFVDRYGRRPCMMAGAAWMFVCFMLTPSQIFASVGHFALDQETPSNTPKAGSAMIVFACLFIAAYASTWGPMVWAVVGEIYPTRYRAKCMGLATASNWTWNFLISFFTPFITGAIDYRYGYVFAACCFAAIFVIYFFMCESQGRSLEEIDTMYVFGVKPWHSAKWQPPEGEELTALDNTYLTPGARNIRKAEAAGQPTAEHNEGIIPDDKPKPTEYHP